MRSLYLAFVAQLATYKKRWWEPVLIVVAIVIATAGLTAVTLISAGASSQLNPLRVGALTAHWQVTAIDNKQPVLPSDYAFLRKQGFDFIVAFTNVGQDTIALDTLALLSLLPPKPRHSGGDAMSLADASSMQDINQYYRGDITPTTHPLSGLALFGELTAARQQQLQQVLPNHLYLAPLVVKTSASNLTDSFNLNLWAIGVLMLLVSVFIVVNALNLLLAARSSLLKKLRQLGISQSILLQTLLVEMFTLACVGASTGVVVGATLIEELTPALSHLYRFLLDGHFGHSELSVGRLLFNSFGICGLAVISMSPIINLRLRQNLVRQGVVVAVLAKRRKGFVMALGAVLCLIIISGYFISSQLQALVYIAALLIIGCITVVLLLPSVLRHISKRVVASLPMLYWSAHNAVSLSHRTKLAACAFFIALVANIGMNIMVDSFRLATQQWLEQRLFAPFYVYTNVATDLSAIENAPITLLARYGRKVNMAGQLSELRSYPDNPVFQSHLMLDTATTFAWDNFYAGSGVFINQQLAYRQQLKLGDALYIPDKLCGSDYTVVGVYPDYGNPRAQVLLPESRLRDEHDQITTYAALASLQQREDLQAWLNQHAPSAKLIPRDRLIQQSMEIFSRTFVTTDTLNLVTMLIASLSFFVSITLLLMDIKPQLLLLRSAGVSQAKIKLALFAQYFFIAISCALVALPFAIILAWLLVNKVNRFAFYWTYSLSLDPWVILQSMFLGLVVLFVLMGLPLGRLQAKFYSQQEAT